MPPSNRPLALVCALIFLLSAAFHLLSAAKGYSHGRDQHFGAAQLIARGETNWLHPVIPGFTANDAPVVQEFPLWQGAAALSMKMLGPWPGWANVASLLLFATAAWPLYGLARSHGDARRAWWALAFFLAQPLSFYLAGSAQADGLCLVAMVWYLYAQDRMLATLRLGWIVLAALSGSLAATLKLPLFFAAGLAGACWVLLKYRTDCKRWAWLGAVGLVCGALFFAWTHYTDSLMARAEMPFVDLRLGTNPEMKYWYFGDWAYRLDARNWIKGGWHFLNGELGSFALVGLLMMGWFVCRSALARVMIASGMLTSLVFAHLILHHWHYVILFSAPVAMLCADAVGWMEERLSGAGRHWLTALGAFAALSLSCTQGLLGSDVVLFFDPYPKRMAELMAAHSAPAERLLVIGGGWGGKELTAADRKGLTLWNAEPLEKPATLERLKAAGFTKLVLLSESPLLNAVQATNPGQSERRRLSYRAALTPLVESWKILYHDEDIYIAALP